MAAQVIEFPSSIEKTNDMAITKNDVSNIVDSKLTPLSRDIQSIQGKIENIATVKGLWQSPLGSAIGGGIIVAILSGLYIHYLGDAKKDIPNEISRQIQSDVVKNEIGSEIARQLAPISQQLADMRESIGKLKDHDNVAKVEPGIPQINAQLTKLEGSNRRITPSEVVSLAKTLQATNPDSRGYWPTVARFITLQASAKAGHSLQPIIVKSFPKCIHVTGNSNNVKIDLYGEYTCTVNLDNLILTNSTISNALVYFSGSVHLSNVQFINCIFVTSLPIVPAGPAKRLATELLEGSVEQKSTIRVEAKLVAISEKVVA